MNHFYITTKNQYIQVDYAKSSRSLCRVCKKSIAKNAIRISISIDEDHFQGKYWHHLQCFQIKPRFKNLNPKTQIYNIDQLEDNDYEQVIDYIKKEIQRFGVGIGKKKSKKQESDSSFVYNQKSKSKSKAKSGRSTSKKSKKSQQKKIAESKSESDEQLSEKKQSPSATQQTPIKSTKKKGKKTQAKKTKKAVTNGYSPTQKKLFKQYCQEYQKMTMDQLKNILVINHQPKTGNKSELVEKCADGKLLGQIPLCKSCGGGKLRFNSTTGIYKCPGYMDDEDFKRCGTNFNRDQIQRQKWINN